MEKTTLEQVKKHFENAKKIRSLGKTEFLQKNIVDYYIRDNNYVFAKLTDNNVVFVYNILQNQFAEIISYKKKTYTLTETFVKELCKEPNIKEAFIREGIIEGTKQETIEEVAIKYAMEEYGSIELKDYTPEMKLNYARLTLAYKQGAKWQQEQDQIKKWKHI